MLCAGFAGINIMCTGFADFGFAIHIFHIFWYVGKNILVRR